MEHTSNLTRQQFLKVLGAGLLSIVVAKVATLETTVTAMSTSKSPGYGTSTYGGRR